MSNGKMIIMVEKNKDASHDDEITTSTKAYKIYKIKFKLKLNLI